MRWIIVNVICLSSVMHAAGLEADALDLRAHMNDFSVFQPGLARCFDVRPHPANPAKRIQDKPTLQVAFRRELVECRSYVRQYPFLVPIVGELDHVQFRFEDPKFPIPMGINDLPVYLGRVQDWRSPAATQPDETIILLRRAYDPGYFCQTTYSTFPVKVDWGATIAHEVTHAWYIRRWIGLHTYFFGLILVTREKDITAFRAESDGEAIDGENAWWRAGKTGIRRLTHDQKLGCYAPLGTSFSVQE